MVNVKDVKHDKANRKSFSKIGDFIEMPNLIKVQKDSYEWFLNEGLGEVLKEVSPIVDYSENLVLEFLDYRMDEHPKYTLEEARENFLNTDVAVEGEKIVLNNKRFTK